MSELRFFLQKSNKFFDKSGAFKAPAFGHESAFEFATQDAALDKAEELGLDLDDVQVIKAKKRPAKQE